jgi:preprotein translocase subunit SecG
METYISIALIITSITLVISIILQSKGAGLGGFTGVDTGGVFTARRGIEKTLFWVTLVLSGVFFVLAITAVILAAHPQI